MNRMHRDENRQVFEWGLVSSLLLLILVFELCPVTEIGRLSTRTTDESLMAVDTFLPFDTSVEEKEEEVLEQQQVLEQQIEQSVREFTQDVTISLSADTTGLSTVSTVESTADFGQTEPSDEEAGPPRFMPTEVFPVCTYRTPPLYPEIAKLAGIEGVVTLWVYVNSSGSVEQVELYASSGVNSLDQVASTAAWDTRWTPARNNGIPVGIWTTLQYKFQLQ